MLKVMKIRNRVTSFCLLLISGCLAAQTVQDLPLTREIHFRKIAGTETGGAVLDVGARGAFDAAWTTCPSVLFDGKRYRMWYSSFYESDVGKGGIGYATSEDGIHWKRENQGQPVLEVGPPGSFDDGQVMGPQVLFENGVYRMWYTGMSVHWHSSHLGYYRIGLATSRDGIHWTRGNKGTPVLDVGATGSHDEVQAATPSILREGRGYRMWYAAWAPSFQHTICTATSDDGIHWRRENSGSPVRGLLSGGQYGPTVIRLGSRYLLLYMRNTSETRGLYTATSHDGFNWTALGTDPAIPTGLEPAFDSSLAGHSSFLAVGNRIIVWYTGYRTESDGVLSWKLRIGAAEVEQDMSAK
jgi:sucrose-6-phosphate hydrolase SacC (GH32 family)